MFCFIFESWTFVDKISAVCKQLAGLASIILETPDCLVHYVMHVHFAYPELTVRLLVNVGE